MSRRDRPGQAAQSDRTAPSAHRRRSKATSAPAHDDFTESFVFIDILGSLVEFCRGSPSGCPAARRPESKTDKKAAVPLSPSEALTLSIVAYDFAPVKRQNVHFDGKTEMRQNPQRLDSGMLGLGRTFRCGLGDWLTMPGEQPRSATEGPCLLLTLCNIYNFLTGKKLA
jgi:hypothetical protein